MLSCAKFLSSSLKRISNCFIGFSSLSLVGRMKTMSEPISSTKEAVGMCLCMNLVKGYTGNLQREDDGCYEVAKFAKHILFVSSGRVDDSLMGGKVGDALVNGSCCIHRTVNRTCCRRCFLSCLHKYKCEAFIFSGNITKVNDVCLLLPWRAFHQCEVVADAVQRFQEQ